MSDLVPDPPRRSNADLINRITLVKGDITRQDDVDAIVSTIGIDMDAGGTLNKAVIAAAGENLDSFILEHIFRPRLGDAFAVPGFNLPVDHVIYVVTPHWRTGLEAEDRDLLRCYRHAIQMAHRMKLKRIAFPALGTGRDKFPVRRAVRLAIQGIMDRLTGQLDEVRIVCNREDIYNVFHERLQRRGWKGNDQSMP